MLIQQYSIPSGSIIEFFKWVSIEFPSLLEVWRKSKKHVSYEGIVVGMSHSIDGIDTNFFIQKIFTHLLKFLRTMLYIKCVPVKHLKFREEAPNVIFTTKE